MAKPKKEIHFHLHDTVVWTDAGWAGSAAEMKQKYGEGPFEVVEVRFHTKQARESSPKGHSEAVTIELKDGVRSEFSGSWFSVVERFRG